MSSALVELPISRWKTTSLTYQTAKHNGQTIRHENASASTLTLPNDADPGENVTVVQMAAGQVTIVVTASGTRVSYGNAYKTAGVGAVVTAVCMSNDTGIVAEWVLSGATAV